MNSPRIAILVAVVALVLSVVALFFAFGLKRQGPPPAPDDRSAPNKSADEDRVQNAEERARMETYVADLQASKKVLKTFQGVEGETIDA
ncbi:MAG: hypothetical protein ACR2HX_25175 [Pyrinomonadaceae bacterium]